MEFKEYIIKNKLGDIFENVDISYLTTIKVGGYAKYLYLPNDINSLCMAYKYIYLNDLKYFIIGKGSNILHINDYYEGIIISLKLIPKKIEVYDDYIIASSNVSLNYLINYMANLNLGNLSFLYGIPGSLGGAIYMNAGAFGDEIKNHIIYVKYINKEGKIITLFPENLKMAYRKSIFMEISGLIVETKIKCVKNMYTKDNLLSIINKRKLIHPFNMKSMGSIFKNLENKKAYQVIQELGLDKLEKNDAKISEIHSNFIINKGHANYKDILFIINKIKEETSKVGIYLEEEIIYLK